MISEGKLKSLEAVSNEKGVITAALGVGDRNCFRIGDEVLLQNRNGQPRGRVKITRAEVNHASKITESQAKALNMSVSELQAYATNEMAKVKAIPKGEPGGFDPKGMVSITFFEFLGDADVIPALTEIIEVNEPGSMAVTCPKDFTPAKTIDIPEKFDGDIMSGKLIGYLQAGDRNCYQIGSIVNLQMKPKVKGETTPIRAKLKIAWVELVPLSKLNDDHAAIMNMTLDQLKVSANEAIKAVKFDSKNTVSITVFEYVPAQ